MFKAALISLGCAFGFALALTPALRAAENATLQTRADATPAKALPLTSTFEKSSETGPYILKLKNTSMDVVKVSAKVSQSVALHANAKDRNISDHSIDPGQVWTISELAATDKVTISADGYAPLELTVP